jgi:predicted ATP-grasp superfamily ATP-dependent carboligase
MSDILVSQSSMKHSLAIIRHLARRGHRVYALAEPTQFGIARFSRYCSGVFECNQRDEVAFLDEVTRILKHHRCDVLIPVGYPVTHFVAKRAAELERLTRFLSPSAAMEGLAIDKVEVSRVAESLGLPVPISVAVSSAGQAQIAARKVGFPLILKSRVEGGSFQARRIHGSGELEDALSSGTGGLMLQEYIPGWGCGFFAIYAGRTCRRIFMHRRLREFPPSGGPSSCAGAFYDERLERCGRTLLDALAWNGVAMAEFRFDIRDRQYKLIEVNAKFWGSLELALAAGADFVDDYVALAAGGERSYTDTYDRSTRYQWLLGGDLQHVIANPGAVGSFLKDLLSSKVRKDIARIDDPLVLALRSLVTGREIGRALLRGWHGPARAH